MPRRALALLGGLLVAGLLLGCDRDGREAGQSAGSGAAGSAAVSAVESNTTQSPPSTFPAPVRGPDPFPGRGRVPFIPPATSPPPAVAPAFPPVHGGFVSPLRIHRTQSGWLLVTDSRRNIVFRVDPATLQPDQALHVDGKPLAVGMLGAEVFVGIVEHKTIRIFSHSGDPAGFLASPGEIAHPADLAIDRSTGLVFALDGLAREVKVYNATERALLGALGAGDLLAPSGVAVDAVHEQVLVSDYGSGDAAASLKVFSYAADTFGRRVATISGAGDCDWFSCSGGFSRPRGPALLGSRVFVPDAVYGQVLVFDRDTGERVSALGSSDPAMRDLRLPSDTVVSPGGDVYVTSTGTQSVVVFPGSAP